MGVSGLREGYLGGRSLPYEGGDFLREAATVQTAQRAWDGRGPGSKPSMGWVCGEGVNTVCSHQSQPAPWGGGEDPSLSAHMAPQLPGPGESHPPTASEPLSIPTLPFTRSGSLEEIHRTVLQEGAALSEVELGWEPALVPLCDLGLTISWIIGRRQATWKWQRGETRMKRQEHGD